VFIVPGNRIQRLHDSDSDINARFTLMCLKCTKRRALPKFKAPATPLGGKGKSATLNFSETLSWRLGVSGGGVVIFHEIWGHEILHDICKKITMFSSE